MSEDINKELYEQLQELKKRLESVETDVKSVKNLNDIGRDVASEIMAEADALRQNNVHIPFLEKKIAKLKVRGKRGFGAKPLTKQEILDVQTISTSGHQAARKLGVAYSTYKKYAKLYGIHTLINYPPKKGVKPFTHLHNPYKGKYPLDEIMAGKWPEFPVHRLKDKLIRGKLKESCCEQCGFKERRMTDGKIPILLSFIDGDKMNRKIENLKILCYNCIFLSGGGYLRKGTKQFDPDILQDSKKIIKARH
jgi:hypothetical protein